MLRSIWEIQGGSQNKDASPEGEAVLESSLTAAFGREGGLSCWSPGGPQVPTHGAGPGWARPLLTGRNGAQEECRAVLNPITDPP